MIWKTLKLNLHSKKYWLYITIWLPLFLCLYFLIIQPIRHAYIHNVVIPVYEKTTTDITIKNIKKRSLTIEWGYDITKKKYKYALSYRMEGGRLFFLINVILILIHISKKWYLYFASIIFSIAIIGHILFIGAVFINPIFLFMIKILITYISNLIILGFPIYYVWKKMARNNVNSMLYL